MPILLNNLEKDSKSTIYTKTYSPKFFDEVLTGAGKKIGLLNESQNPVNIPNSRTTTDINIYMRKRKYLNGNTETKFIPLFALDRDAWRYIRSLSLKDKSVLHQVGITADTNYNTNKVYINMIPHGLILETKTDKSTTKTIKKKKLVATYQIFIYLAEDNTQNVASISDTRNISTFTKNVFYTFYTTNPTQYFTDKLKELEYYHYDIDYKKVYDYINSYDLYQGICEKSKIWQETINEEFDLFFDNLKTIPHSKDVLNTVSKILHRIEDYNIPLDLYRDIYKSLISTFDHDIATTLCKQNLNLLLSDTLNNLNNNKSQLTSFKANPKAKIDPKFSNEQKAAIKAEEPLVMVQSGAGSGKSSVVLARIKYLMDCGIKPEDITVLSFTNAAANNIMNKNPGVNSYTIAKMIHEIYTLNYPKHELSTIDTVMNSIDIYFKNDDLAQEFKQKLFSIAKNDPDSFTKMNNFIEKNLTEVLNILDYLKQTTLELEIIICYQQIENLQEPNEIQSKFLIIDEVQDNSIFEFIYTLKYVDKHKESLFIVGRTIAHSKPY